AAAAGRACDLAGVPPHVPARQWAHAYARPVAQGHASLGRGDRLVGGFGEIPRGEAKGDEPDDHGEADPPKRRRPPRKRGYVELEDGSEEKHHDDGDPGNDEVQNHSADNRDDPSADDHASYRPPPKLPRVNAEGQRALVRLTIMFAWIP